MPAYGFYARNSRGLTLQNVRFQVSTPEMRPAVIFDHVEDVAVNGLGEFRSRVGVALHRFEANPVNCFAPFVISRSISST
jgi:hypothetical protein